MQAPESAERSLQLSIYALACRDALDLGRPERVTLYCVDESRRSSAERTDAAKRRQDREIEIARRRLVAHRERRKREQKPIDRL